MSKNPLRLAFVWPGGGSEQEYYQFAEATGDQVKILLACSRVGATGEGSDHDIEELLETARIDWILDAAKRSVCLRPDTVFWACTSGTFVVGRQGAEEQISALQEVTGVSAGSTSLSFVDAISQLGFRRVGVHRLWRCDHSPVRRRHDRRIHPGYQQPGRRVGHGDHHYQPGRRPGRHQCW